MERLRVVIVETPWATGLVAVLLGALIGVVAAIGSIYAFAALLALGVAVAVLTSTEAGLLGAVSLMTLLPFGTLPFKAIITPTLLSLALVGLMVVWSLRLLARSDQYDLRMTVIGLPVLGFLGLTLFSLILGAGGLPDSQTLHNYAKFVLGVLFFFSVINTVRTREQARLFVQMIILCGGMAAAVGLLLYAMNDTLAQTILVSLGRIGYPTSGRVLRYVEDDTSGIERAIGTSIDPNSFGGMLALVGALSAAQLFASRPVLSRPLLVGTTGTIGLALLLTFSRAALFGVVIAMMYIATLRYRRLWWVMVVAAVIGAVLLSGLGIGEEFIQRVTDGVQFRDQAQQMRLAEFQNAIAIIQRYPVFGIGFGSAPDIDLTAGVSSIYLAIGQRLGLVGLTAFLGTVAAWFVHVVRLMRGADEELVALLLGVQAAIVAALAVGLADHYFFNIEFSHMVALFWGCIGLGMAITKEKSL